MFFPIYLIVSDRRSNCRLYKRCFFRRHQFLGWEGFKESIKDLAASNTFERFKSDTELLNNIGTYKHLTERASKIGYKVEKVVFRGYR